MAVCLEHGCPVVVSSGRCPEHEKQYQQAYERQRNDASHRKVLGSSRWRKYSRWWLDLHPFCGEREDGQRYGNQSICVQEGRVSAATVTDHIIPLSKGGSAWNRKNHQSLCARCNTQKGDALPNDDGVWAHRDEDRHVFS